MIVEPDCILANSAYISCAQGAYQTSLDHHGSGCTLASAIAALLAKGLEVEQAVRQAQEYAWKSLAAGFKPGRGQAIPDRFFASR